MEKFQSAEANSKVKDWLQPPRLVINHRSRSWSHSEVQNFAEQTNTVLSATFLTSLCGETHIKCRVCSLEPFKHQGCVVHIGNYQDRSATLRCLWFIVRKREIEKFSRNLSQNSSSPFNVLKKQY